MKYKGWLILTIILGFFWVPFWILSVIIAVLGIYADKKKVTVRRTTMVRKKRKVTKKKKPKEKTRKKRR